MQSKQQTGFPFWRTFRVPGRQLSLQTDTGACSTHTVFITQFISIQENIIIHAQMSQLRRLNIRLHLGEPVTPDDRDVVHDKLVALL